MKLLKKIKINPLSWFVIGMGTITGYFREIIMVFSIVLIHELGHSFAAQYFHWKIRSIELLPFGGVAQVEEYGNRSLKEEFIVIIAGPVQHLWLIALSFLSVQFDFWTVNDHKTFIMHNLMILSFNLLPIWPLDGGKLLHIYFSKKLAFQQSLLITLKTSMAFLILFTFISIYYLPFHLNLWIVLLFLKFSHYREWKQRSFSFMQFLMERYHQRVTPFGETVPIVVSGEITVHEALKKFQRGVRHKIVISDFSYNGKKIVGEDVLLHAFFSESRGQIKLKAIVSE